MMPSLQKIALSGYHPQDQLRTDNINELTHAKADAKGRHYEAHEHQHPHVKYNKVVDV